MVIRRFPIRFTNLNKLMEIVGLRRSHAYVDVGPDEVHVNMGWAFDLTVPRSSIRSAAEDHGRVLGWGVHGWRGEWLVNGSSSGLVRIELDPPRRARMIVVPVQLR